MRRAVAAAAAAAAADRRGAPRDPRRARARAAARRRGPARRRQDHPHPPRPAHAGLAGLETAPREVLVLQPRRIAARMSAQRVAESLGEPLGRRVGYQVRFESAVGPRPACASSPRACSAASCTPTPTLRGSACVVLDEFHERHLDGDLGLALLRQLQRGARPDLRDRRHVGHPRRRAGPALPVLGQMSARASAAPGACTRSRSSTRARWCRGRSCQPASTGPSIALDEEPGGDVLVFLPGAREIQQAAERLRRPGRARGVRRAAAARRAPARAAGPGRKARQRRAS
jgi:ATP-dependent helicase HrpB